MTVLQLANLFASLPHEKMREVSGWLRPSARQAVQQPPDRARGDGARHGVGRASSPAGHGARWPTCCASSAAPATSRAALSYVYVVADEAPVLQGVVDLRDLVLAPDDTTLADIMISPVVAAQDTDLREDLEKMFEKYGFGMMPGGGRPGPPARRHPLQRHHEGAGAEYVGLGLANGECDWRLTMGRVT